MNQKAQRDTGGELGSFCVSCHAPMAVRLGLTTDGLNLEHLPEHVQGITCYFCHSINEVGDRHGAPLTLAMDGVMRGGFRDPAPNEAHESTYSPLLDGDDVRSAPLCGACHNGVNQHGIAMDQTFTEWSNSLYARAGPDQKTCGACHLPEGSGYGAVGEGFEPRRVHDHRMVGVNGALSPFPNREDQARWIQRSLNRTVGAQLCVRSVNGGSEIQVILENSGAGHAFPSGISVFSRVWVELIAYDQADRVIFSSGVVNDGQSLTELDDPQLWQLGTRALDSDGLPTYELWRIRSRSDDSLPPPTASSSAEANFTDIHKTKRYRVPDETPSYVSLRVRLRPIGLDILDDLIASGDLEAAYRDLVPTFDLGLTRLDWAAEDQEVCIPRDHVERFK